MKHIWCRGLRVPDWKVRGDNPTIHRLPQRGCCERSLRALQPEYGLGSHHRWHFAVWFAGIVHLQRDRTFGRNSCRCASSPGNRPIKYVSWFDAARFANWMHNGQGSGSTGRDRGLVHAEWRDDGEYFGCQPRCTVLHSIRK